MNGKVRDVYLTAKYHNIKQKGNYQAKGNCSQ
jgi:hypothetical protein